MDQKFMYNQFYCRHQIGKFFFFPLKLLCLAELSFTLLTFTYVCTSVMLDKQRKITFKLNKHKKNIYAWEVMDISPLYVVHRGRVALIPHCTGISFL
jgi:hypothetical protein